MKKKLLFVYDSMMTGGTSTALLSLINTLDRRKFDIDLLLYTNTGAMMGEIPDFVRLLPPAYKPSRFLSSGKRKIIRTVFNGRVCLALKAWMKYRKTPKGNLRLVLMHYGMKAQVSLSRRIEEKYDCAIAFMEGWASEYVASPKIQAAKKYVWVHPQYESCYLIPEIDRKTFAKVDGIALVSEKCLNSFFGFFPEYKKKTYVVPNLMSHKLVHQKAYATDVKIKKADINFCTVCRCDIQVKGLDRLLKVFYKLKQEGLTKGVLWHLIGGGDELEQFKNEIDRLGMGDTIVLYGNQLNPLPYVRQMDAFVLASRYEGKPVAITEAQILGLPCLVTNYDSAASQVKHGFNGIIMENNYESIYASLKKVIQLPSLLSEWRRNTLSEAYGNERDIEAFYDLIEDVSDVPKKEILSESY